MKYIKIVKIAYLCTIIITMTLVLSCDKPKEEKISIDYSISGIWEEAFLDASKTFQIGETKKIIFDNPYDADRCIIITGGSIIAEPDVLYKKYVDNGIPAVAAKKLIRENMGEGLRVFFLKDDTILNSIVLMRPHSGNNIYCTEIGKKITFTIQLPAPLAERITQDPNFLEIPEFGKDYLTNPDRPKPIEIVRIE